MKEYKIDLSMLDGEAREDVSATIQRHAFRLGYEWIFVGNKTQYEYYPTLCFEADGKILMDDYLDRFNKLRNTEISITDFLALTPEDVRDEIATTTEPEDAPELKPFDKVLVRDCDGDEWGIDLFESFSEDAPYSFQCLHYEWKQCIHYEGNEHLLGTTEDAE